MHGLVSLLDDDHYQATLDLWAELDEALGLRGVYVTPYPHFSYHVAHGYAGPQLAEAARALARGAAPFTVSTAGLGIFTGPAPVLYLPVVRTLALSRLHAAVFEAAQPYARGPVSYYAPEHWLPHITLGFGDLDAERLAAAVRRLSGRPFNWTIAIDNLAYIEDTGQEQVLRWRLPLGRE